MRNYSKKIKFAAVVVLLFSTVLNSCVVRPKKGFDVGLLFKNSFYDNAIYDPATVPGDIIPATLITPFYVGFNQNYVPNNHIFELSMSPPYYRYSAIGRVTGEINKYAEKTPVLDSEEMFIIRLKKTFDNVKENNFMDTAGYYYLFASFKYDPFMIDGKQQYKVTGYGHVYLASEDTATGDLLFRRELTITHDKDYSASRLAKLFKKKNRYHLTKGGKVLLLFQTRPPAKKTNDKKTDDSKTDDSLYTKPYTNHPHLYSLKKEEPLDFCYIIVGNYNQMGGRKFLDVSVDSVFHHRALRFGPYPPK